MKRTAEVAPKCLKINCDVEKTDCLKRRLRGHYGKTIGVEEKG